MGAEVIDFQSIDRSNEFWKKEINSRKGCTGDDGGGSGMNERIARIEVSLEHMQTDIGGLRNDIRQIRNEMSQIRWWILGALISILAAIVAFGSYQATWFQQGINQNMVMIDKMNQNTQLKIEALEKNTQLQLDALEKNAQQNWESAQKALDRIDAAQMRLERIETLQRSGKK